MSTLLISMLGSAPPGSDRPGQPLATFRLPLGERIVETSHLGIELGRAIQADVVYLVGTPYAYFDQLCDLLPQQEAQAPVEEATPPPAPQGEAAEEQHAPAEPVPGPMDEAPAEDSSGGEAATAATTEPEAEAPASADEPAESEPAATEEPPAAAEAPPSEDPPPAEPAAGGETSAAPEAPAAEPVQPSEEAAPATEAAPDLPEESAPASDEPQGEAPAAAEQPQEPAGNDRSPEVRARPSVPRKAHEPDPRPLAARLAAQADSGRPDRGALDALAQRLGRALGLKQVRCLLISAPTDDRSFQASVRNLVEIPEAGDEVNVDVTYGERTLPLLGCLVLDYLARFRPDVKVGRVLQGAPEHADRGGIAPIISLTAPMEMMRWMHGFEAVQQGQAPAVLHDLMNEDRRLQGLAGPYVRYQRGVQFGAVSEVVQGARLLDERRRKLNRLPYAHRYRIFDRVLENALSPFLEDRPLSVLQLECAGRSLASGHVTFAGLHLREAILSYCLELFGQNPTRTWVDVPQSGGAQEVRTREVAGYVLALPEAKRLFGDLELAWPVLKDARRAYVYVTGSTAPASQLKQFSHEIGRLFAIVRNLITQNGLDGLQEGRDFAHIIKESIDRQAVRPREARRRRPPRRTRDGGPPHERTGERPTRRSTSAEGGGRRPQTRDGGPRRREDSRPPRGDRPRGDRPRGDRPRGDRPYGDRPRRPPPPGDDATPRVERLGGGMGNLGLALQGAGLVQEPPKKKPREEKPAPPPTEAPADQAPSPEAPPPALAAPVQEEAVKPEPPAPDESSEEGEKEKTFDVAGPKAPPPTE